jgi:hypothetical protein
MVGLGFAQPTTFAITIPKQIWLEHFKFYVFFGRGISSNSLHDFLLKCGMRVLLSLVAHK